MIAGSPLLLLGCLALVVWGCWRWAAVTGLEAGPDLLVAWGVLVSGTVVGTVLLTGAVGALSAGPVAAAAAGTAGLALATTVSRRQRARIGASRRAVRAALGRLGRAVRSPFVLLLALAALAAVGYRLLIAVAFPVLDWDAFAYHLPMADYWLQERRLLTTPVSFWAQIYPGAAESGIAWLGALTGSVRAAAAVQAAAGLFGALTVVALCRGAGCDPRWSVAGGLLFLLAPLVLTQLSTAEVDVAAAATLLACWHLLLVALRRDGRRERDAEPEDAGPVETPPPAPDPAGSGGVAVAHRPPRTAARHAARRAAARPGVLPVLVVAGVGAGVAAGVKSTNLLAVGVLGLVLMGTCLWRGVVRERTPGRAVGRTLLRAACFGLPALVLGGWWYLRNALLWGNPFYPVPIAGLPGNEELLGFAAVDPRQVGTTNSAWAVLVSWASDLQWREYYYGSPLGGLGAHWLLVLAPAVLVAFPLLLRSRDFLYAWGFLVPGVVLLVAYPAQYHPRYTLFLLGVGGVALAVVLTRLPAPPRQAVLALVAGGAVFSAAAASWRALDVAGSFESGPTPAEVLALARMPAAERELVGLRAAFAEVEEAEPGSTFVVPPEFGDYGQPWVLPHSMWGDDLTRRVVQSADPIEDADQALAALEAHDARYVVVIKGSPLETALLAEPDRLHPAFDVGWLARAWAAGPGPAD
ncbi:hypothetical protein ACI797_13700 [Geodermatophilus sp. SYSU D00691]